MTAAGRAVHRADAREVKAFIRSFVILGMTDAIDAAALARYGQERHADLARWQAMDLERDRLQALVLTRRDIVAQRLSCANRLKALGAPGAEPVEAYLAAILACCETQLAAIEREIDAVIARHDPHARDRRHRQCQDPRRHTRGGDRLTPATARGRDRHIRPSMERPAPNHPGRAVNDPRPPNDGGATRRH